MRVARGRMMRSSAWPRDIPSALASTITLLELTGMSRTIIARTYQPVEIFLMAGVFYLLSAYVLVRLFRLLEKRLRVDACQGR